MSKPIVGPRELTATSLDKVMARQDWGRLTPHLLQLSVDVGATTESLKRFTRSLLEWNGRVSNLISRNDAGRILERHILESIEPAHLLKASGAATWLDFGSGGGFPAIPLALAGVGQHWTLVESRRNKSLFLRRAIHESGLKNVEVVLDRLENRTGSDWEAAFDGFTSRAAETLAPTLELAAHFVRPGGVAFLWKGSRRESEMVSGGAWQADWQLEGLLGIGNGQTVVCRFRRTPYFVGD